MKFGKKPEQQAVVMAPAPKFGKRIVAEVKKAKRIPFNREYTRELKFLDETKTYLWEFEEYGKVTQDTPQPRLQEKHYVMEGRDKRYLPFSPVAWQVELEVRMEAYRDFLNHIKE